jgi:hypothetical protein
MLWLTRKMTTRGCVWRSGSLTVEIATFPLAAVAVAVIAAEIAPTSAVPRTPNSSSTCHPEQSEGPAFDRATALPGSNGVVACFQRVFHSIDLWSTLVPNFKANTNREAQ